jgi:diadenosine tetraphosphatase ApaH/serine/threonine PP2A family protein phosphatase
VQLSDGRLIVNPGSVGCPAYEDDQPVFHKIETGHPMASYAILEKADRGWSVQFRNVPYNHMAMSRLAASRSRLDWALTLASGRI